MDAYTVWALNAPYDVTTSSVQDQSYQLIGVRRGSQWSGIEFYSTTHRERTPWLNTIKEADKAVKPPMYVDIQ